MIEDQYFCLECKEIFKKSDRIKDFSINPETGKEYYPPWSFYCPFCRSINLELLESLEKIIENEKKKEIYHIRRSAIYKERFIRNQIIYPLYWCVSGLTFSITLISTLNLFFAILNTILSIMIITLLKGH